WWRPAPTTSPRPITVRNRAKIRPMLSSTRPTLLSTAATPTATKATAPVTQPRLDRLRRAVQLRGGGSPQARVVVAAPPGGGPPSAWPSDAGAEDRGPPQAWAVPGAPAWDGGPHPAAAGPTPRLAGGGPAGGVPACPGPPVTVRSPPDGRGPPPAEG